MMACRAASFSRRGVARQGGQVRASLKKTGEWCSVVGVCATGSARTCAWVTTAPTLPTQHGRGGASRHYGRDEEPLLTQTGLTEHDSLRHCRGYDTVAKGGEGKGREGGR